MRSRRLISIVALLGVLLHAGALVRHAAVMLDATLQHQALVVGLAQICHTAGTPADADLPAIPKPTDAQNGCPICSGLGTAFALAAPELASILLPPPAEIPVIEAQEDARPQTRKAVRPPSRGPPATA